MSTGGHVTQRRRFDNLNLAGIGPSFKIDDSGNARNLLPHEITTYGRLGSPDGLNPTNNFVMSMVRATQS